jgi:hypothetical protein
MYLHGSMSEEEKKRDNPKGEITREKEGWGEGNKKNSRRLGCWKERREAWGGSFG